MAVPDQDNIYCFPGTDILRNIYTERDPENLEKLERMLSGARLVDLLKKPIKGHFDVKHLKKIHHYLFQDIYSWAGKFRICDISKGVHFCKAEFIEKELGKLFAKLKEENYLENLNEEALFSRAAFYLGEINAIHPFRDGNGRTQREFIRELMLARGYKLDYSRCDPKMMLSASIDSFAGDNTLMIELIKICTIRCTMSPKL